jgi:hypothetical protein
MIHQLKTGRRITTSRGAKNCDEIRRKLLDAREDQSNSDSLLLLVLNLKPTRHLNFSLIKDAAHAFGVRKLNVRTENTFASPFPKGPLYQRPFDVAVDEDGASATVGLRLRRVRFLLNYLAFAD